MNVTAVAATPALRSAFTTMNLSETIVDNDFNEPNVLAPELAERGLRLDRFLAGRYPALSRTYLQRVLAGEGVRVDGVVRQQTFKVTPGQVIEVIFPEAEEC